MPQLSTERKKKKREKENLKIYFEALCFADAESNNKGSYIPQLITEPDTSKTLQVSLFAAAWKGAAPSM